MPDRQRASSPGIYSRPESPSEQKTVIRKFISPAIYVEKSVMAPFRKRSALVVSDEAPKDAEDPTTKLNASSQKLESSTSSTSTEESLITVKSKPKTASSLRLDYEKEESMKQWLKKKDEEKKMREKKEALLKEKQRKEKQKLLEQERANFLRWLSNKKKQEEKLRREKQQREEEKTKVEEEKERKRKENEERYNRWLLQKKRAELERKINEQLAMLHIYEEKQRRMEESEHAFKEWVRNSKNKPRPVPMNQGLQSLYSSTSVTFINPVPWTPNVENMQKPVSQ